MKVRVSKRWMTVQRIDTFWVVLGSAAIVSRLFLQSKVASVHYRVNRIIIRGCRLDPYIYIYMFSNNIPEFFLLSKIRLLTTNLVKNMTIMALIKINYCWDKLKTKNLKICDC